MKMPEGSTIVLRGRYTHARYQSLIAYNIATTTATDGVNDVQTRARRRLTQPVPRRAPSAPVSATAPTPSRCATSCRRPTRPSASPTRSTSASPAKRDRASSTASTCPTRAAT